jgi:hypothetical protein
MCVVSMIADHYADRYRGGTPSWQPNFTPLPHAQGVLVGNPLVTRAEFDELRRDMEEMKKLLVRAKDYDARNGEPDCEMDEKVALLRRIAAMVGITLDDIFGEQA